MAQADLNSGNPGSTKRLEIEVRTRSCVPAFEPRESTASDAIKGLKKQAEEARGADQRSDEGFKPFGVRDRAAPALGC